MHITTILDASQIETAIKTLSCEVINQSTMPQHLILVGIQRRGVIIATRLQKIIMERIGVMPTLATLDITFYRDDWTTLRTHPIIGESHITVPLDNRQILLVDDVLFTGRTIRAALEALNNYGRPAQVSLLVLVDRGHRELPIQPDYVGFSLQTKQQDTINVLVRELDNNDAVLLEQE